MSGSDSNSLSDSESRNSLSSDSENEGFRVVAPPSEGATIEHYKKVHSSLLHDLDFACAN